MELRLLAAVVLITVIHSSYAGINPSVCLPVNINEGKDFPSIPNNFHATMQWNMKTENTTYFIDEVFSEDAGVGVMLIENLIGNGVRTKMLTYGPTAEYIMIEDFDNAYGSKCDVDKLSSTDFTFPFKTVKGKDKLLSGKDVLMLGANNAAMAYVGTDTLDDIDVDVWNGCLYLTDTDLTLNATFYFTINETGQDNWQTASSWPVSVKRIMLTGLDSTGKSKVDQIYQFVLFDTTIPYDAEYYEVPLGAYCPGRKTTRKLPDVPQQFKLKMESFVSGDSRDVVTYFDEIYDFNSNYTRIDRNTRTNADNTSTVIRVVHDYNSGVEYHMSKYGGFCTMEAIAPDDYDNAPLNDTQREDLVRLRNPQEFFDFDNQDKYPYIYQGVHHVRGIQCDVWISKRPYPNEDSEVFGFYEWYFTSSGVVIDNGDVEEDQEPFKLVITAPDIGVKKEYSIYYFNQEPPDARYFDIKNCFDMNNESRAYEFVMNADVARYNLDQNEGILKYWIAFAVEAFAGVRSIRVTDIEFMFTRRKVYVRFRILDAPNVPGSVKHPATQLSLDEADQYLESSITSQDFKVYYVQSDGLQAEFSVDPTSLTRQTMNTGSSTYYVVDNDGRDDSITPSNTPVRLPADVSNGAAAAIAMVLLIVGVLVVVLPYYFIVIRKSKELDLYNNSHLTMNDM